MGTVGGGVDDADGKDVEHLVEGNVLLLHLHPDGVWAFHSRLDGIVDAHFVKALADGRDEGRSEDVACLLGGSQFVKDVLIGLRVLIVEGEILEFRLDLVESEAVGNRGEDIECFTCNLILLRREHARKRAHVVETVGNLDEDDTDVVTHHQEEFLEGFGLKRCAVAEDATGNLGDSFHNVCHFLSEKVAEVLVGIVRVLFHVVEQGGADGSGSQSDFFTGDLRHSDGVQDIGFT